MDGVGFRVSLKCFPGLVLFPYATVCARGHFAQDSNLRDGMRTGNRGRFCPGRGGKKLVEGAFFWEKCHFQPAAPLQPGEGPTEGHFALYAGKCAGQDFQSFSSTLFPGAAGPWISPAGTGSLRHMAWFRGVPLRGCAVGCDVGRVLASAVQGRRANRCM